MDKKTEKNRKLKETIEEKSPPKPYENDFEYFQEEFDWLEARANRLFMEEEYGELAPGKTKTQEDESNELNHGLNLSPETRRAYGKQMYRLSYLRERYVYYKKLEAALRRRIDERKKITAQAGYELSFVKLCSMYELNELEQVSVLLALAPSVSSKYDELVRVDKYGHSDKFRLAYLTIEMIFNFLELGLEKRITARKFFAPASKLAAKEILIIGGRRSIESEKDVLGLDVSITNRAFKFLMGDNSLDSDFAEFTQLEEPKATFDNVVLDEADKERIMSVIENRDKYLKCRAQWGFDEVIGYGRGSLMLFYGNPGTGKTMTAHAIASKLGKKLLNISLFKLSEVRDVERFIPSVFREAKLQDAVLFFDECESLFEARCYGNALMTVFLREIERFDGVALLATNMPEALDEALLRRILVKVAFKDPDKEARLNIWKNHLPKSAPLGSDIDLDLIASRYEMTGGLIKNAVLEASGMAVYEGKEPLKISMKHLETAAANQIKAPLDDESKILTWPKVKLDRVILDNDARRAIDDLISMSRNKDVVFSKWGLGAHLSHGKGIAALFYGEPGTGKTLCAEAVAAELSRPLLSVSVAQINSMWVGETEKNIEVVFKRARQENAVLFLDECDSMLSARNSSRDSKYELRSVNVFLKMIEKHDGIVILATNLADNLDKALERRIGFRVQFVNPTPEMRADIWKTLLPEKAPIEGAIDFERLGKLFDYSGGYIKNAVFKAVFKAAIENMTITQELLEEAGEIEAAARIGVKKKVGFTSRIAPLKAVNN